MRVELLGFKKHIKKNEYEAPVALKDEGEIARRALEGTKNEC